MLIRKAKLKDAAAIAKVHVDSWRTTYRGILPESYLSQLSYKKRESSWAKMLSTAVEKNHFIYVAENNMGQVIALANGGKERTNNPIYHGELYAIYILETYQKQGIGKNLIQTIAEKLSQSGWDSMLVWVLANNPACQFYQTLGGQKIDQKQIERGELMLTEVAYGWLDTKVLWQHIT